MSVKKPIPKTHGNRNRTAGYGLEKLVARLMRAAGFPYVVTTRSESKSRDDAGVDLMNHDEITNGRLPYSIQCKNSTERPQYDKLLAGMPQEPGIKNVIIHKYTIKQKTMFNPRGHYAIMTMTDFLGMITELEQLRSVNKVIEKEVLG